MWAQRDQFSNQQIPLQDHDIILRQHEQWLANLSHSEKSKALVNENRPADHMTVGDLVYLLSDRNKTRARDRYLVVEITGSFCNIRKFVGSQLRSTSYRVKTSECYRVPSEVIGFRPSAFNNDADSSADETSPLLAAPRPPSPPVIPGANSTPATQEVSRPVDFTTNYSDPCDTHPDPEGDSHASDSDSDTPPPPRRSTRKRRRPARYDDFVTDFTY